MIYLLLAAIFVKVFGYLILVPFPAGMDNDTFMRIAAERAAWEYVLSHGADAVMVTMAAWYAHRMNHRVPALACMYLAFEDAQSASCGMLDVTPKVGMCLEAFGPSPYLLAAAMGLVYLGWASRVRTK